MNELKVNYQDNIGKYLFCVRNDRAFGIRSGKGYKILSLDEHDGDYFYNIMTEKVKFSNGISFKVNSKSFLSVEESLYKLRELKMQRILGGTEDQTFYSD